LIKSRYVYLAHLALLSIKNCIDLISALLTISETLFFPIQIATANSSKQRTALPMPMSKAVVPHSALRASKVI